MIKSNAHERITRKPFSLLVKPTSADCNLRCTYCFYLEKASLYPDNKVHRMSHEVLDRMISSYLKTPQGLYSFGWQGGEPLLMGFDFFKETIRLQKQYGKPGLQAANGVQTNGTLITEDFAKLFRDYNFLVGISLDGPEEIHNKYRVNIQGKGTFASVMTGIDLLRKHRVEFNILVLVSESNVERGKEVYNFLVENGFYYHQYIPCVEFDDEGNLLPYSINGKQWGQFLSDVFDEWYPKDTHKVSIRHLDSVLEHLIRGTYNVCTMGGMCNQYYVVEHNGDIYPCDFFVEPDLKLGNIMEDEWGQFERNSTYRKFGSQKTNWNSLCSTCHYLEFCSGDCLKNRFSKANDPTLLSVLCEGWKMFYKKTLPPLKGLARHVLNERFAQNGNFNELPDFSPSPDDPCLCGSGKKYKNCHGVKIV
jgi:uncharacterized protein